MLLRQSLEWTHFSAIEREQEASLSDQTEKSTGQIALACVTVQWSGKQALPMHCGKIF